MYFSVGNPEVPSRMLKLEYVEQAMVILICVLLAGVAIGFTLFVREQDIPAAPTENPELKHLETRRQVLYDNLKDLQFEFHQGKLSDQDYQSLKQGFLYDLAGVMDSIERMELSAGKDAKSTHKAGHRAAPATPSISKKEPASTQKEPAHAPSNLCPSCKAANPEGHRFCGHCGQPLPQ